MLKMNFVSPQQGAFVIAVAASAALLAALVPASSSSAASPPVSGGCEGAAHSQHANTTAAAIPDNTTVTSTIVVAGVGTHLRDVDLKTNITHTFPGDLDIRLTSPAGTVSTITTDNGSSAVNAFNGTVWDDSADPGNAGPITDQTFVANTTSSPLVPEEALGAFAGEDPNGTWTLTVADDAGGDTGTLTSWRLNLQTLPGPPANQRSFAATAASPTTIPVSGTITSTVTVAGAGANIGDVDLTTNITHAFPTDIDMRLTSPAGTISTMTTDNGGSATNAFNGTVWDDRGDLGNDGPITDRSFAANVVETPVVPEEAMSAFAGEDPNGTWTLTITDDFAPDGGTLESWSLSGNTICTPAPPPADSPPEQTPPPDGGGQATGPAAITIRDTKVKEGDRKATTARVPVVLSASSSDPVEVAFATEPGSAKAKRDFKAKTGTLTFAPGELEKKIAVKVLGDRAEEGKEKFSVELSDAVNATIGRSAATVSIRKSD